MLLSILLGRPGHSLRSIAADVGPFELLEATQRPGLQIGTVLKDLSRCVAAERMKVMQHVHLNEVSKLMGNAEP